jgi:putative ABC transport system substrate-binding protein
MRRRELITLIGGAAAWPLTAHAQQSIGPIVGFLYPGSPETMANRLAAFRQGLSEMGFVEGRNVTIEYRWAYYDELDRLQVLAGDLVSLRVAAIAAGTINLKTAKLMGLAVPPTLRALATEVIE